MSKSFYANNDYSYYNRSNFSSPVVLGADDFEPSRTDQSFYVPVGRQVQDFIMSGKNVLSVKSSRTRCNADDSKTLQISDFDRNLYDHDLAEISAMSARLDARAKEKEDKEKLIKSVTADYKKALGIEESENN